MATDNQIAFISNLVAKSSYPSVIDAIDAYGLGLRTARDLSIGEASEMIDFLTGKPHRASIASIAPVKTKAVKLIGSTMAAPSPIQNVGGRVGKLAANKKRVSGLVVSDAGDRVDIQFADGSFNTYLTSFVTFA